MLCVLTIIFSPLPAGSQTTGSISGRITETGTSTSIYNALICAFPFDQTGNLGLCMSDGNGNYLITDLLDAEYYVVASAPDQNYIRAYFDDTLYRAYADTVKVTAGEDTPNIDFELAQGGMISGRVVDGYGEGIEGVFVNSYLDCNRNDLEYTQTDATGAFTIQGLPAGSVYLHAQPSRTNPVSYISEWYGDAALCEDASPVTVAIGTTTADIDFQLEPAGTISGTVLESDGTTPVADMPVYLLSDPCDGPTLHYTFTDDAGEYFIGTLVPGDVYVYVPSEFASEPHLSGKYLRGWFDGVFSCEEAESVLIEATVEASEKNFFLYDSTDSDGDSMPDHWENNYFGDTLRDGSGDFDGDGIVDFDEYLAGYNPDFAGNTLEVSISDDPPLNENESDQSDSNLNSSDSGGGCFISTAACCTSKENDWWLPVFYLIILCLIYGKRMASNLHF
jgi:hypothetical protein